MKTKEMLMRLLWKEMRESYLVYAALFLIPLIIFPMKVLFDKSDFIVGVVVVSAILIPLLVIIWGSEKGIQDNLTIRSQKYIIPIKPIQSWAISFFVHAVLLAFLGFWFLKWFLEFVDQLNYDVRLIPSIGIFLFISIYAISYSFTSAFTRWTGILLGIIWTIVFFIYLNSKSKQFNNNEWMWITIVVFCFILATLCLHILRKKGVTFVKRISIFMFFFPLILLIILNINTTGVFEYPSGEYTLNSQRLKRRLVNSSNGNNFRFNLSFIKYDNSKGFKRKFKEPIEILCLQDNRYIFLYTTHIFTNNVEILRWDIAINKVESYLKWRSFINPLQTCINIEDIFNSGNPYLRDFYCDPTGKYVIIEQNSVIGDGSDLIIINLPKKTMKMIVIDKWFSNYQVVWRGTKAYVSGDYPMIIDIEKGTYIDLTKDLPNFNALNDTLVKQVKELIRTEKRND